MSEKAFPVIEVFQPWNHDTKEYDGVQTTIHAEGMLLRDYFAAQALVGLVSNESFVAFCRGVAVGRNEPTTPLGMRALAVNAYDIADAMLAERSKA